MSTYTPDRWMMVKITAKDTGAVHYRIFAVWSGSYAHSAAWKLNSGVTTVVENEDDYEFSGASGSVYVCRKSSYGSSAYGFGVLQTLKANSVEVTIEDLPEETNFMEIDYGE